MKTSVATALSDKNYKSTVYLTTSCILFSPDEQNAINAAHQYNQLDFFSISIIQIVTNVHVYSSAYTPDAYIRRIHICLPLYRLQLHYRQM